MKCARQKRKQLEEVYSFRVILFPSLTVLSTEIRTEERNALSEVHGLVLVHGTHFIPVPLLALVWTRALDNYFRGRSQ
jgi:hypothetical protein